MRKERWERRDGDKQMRCIKQKERNRFVLLTVNNLSASLDYYSYLFWLLWIYFTYLSCCASSGPDASTQTRTNTYLYFYSWWPSHESFFSMSPKESASSLPGVRPVQPTCSTSTWDAPRDPADWMLSWLYFTKRSLFEKWSARCFFFFFFF